MRSDGKEYVVTDTDTILFRFNGEPLAKWPMRPTYALYSKFYPRNISYMPVVKLFTCLDFERKFSFCKRLCLKEKTQGAKGRRWKS